MTALTTLRGQASRFAVKGTAIGPAIFVLSGMYLLSVLDGTVVMVAMPKIQANLHLTDAGRSWIVTAYAIAFGGLMLLGGRLGDTFGRKRMFIGGVAGFTLMSLSCGLAQNELMLIVSRVLQGASAAVAVPTAMALVATTFAPGKQRNQAFAIFAAMAGIGSVSGLIAGGFLATFSWRLVFLVNVPIGIVCALGAYVVLDESEDEQRHSLDTKGAALATIGCIVTAYSFITGPEGWTRPDVIAGLVIGLGCAVAFFLVERTAENPILPFVLFRNHSRVAAMVAIMFCGALMMCLALYVCLALQDILNYTPLESGLALVPFAFGLGIAAAVASKLALVIQTRWLVMFGGAIVLAGCVYVPTLVDDHPSYFPTLFIPVVVIGVGVGFASVSLALAVVAGVKPSEIGPLTALAQVGQNLGGGVGLVIVQAMVTSRVLSLGGTTATTADRSGRQIEALTSGYTLAFQACAAMGFIAGVVVFFMRFTPHDVAEGQVAQDAAHSGADVETTSVAETSKSSGTQRRVPVAASGSRRAVADTEAFRVPTPRSGEDAATRPLPVAAPISRSRRVTATSYAAATVTTEHQSRRARHTQSAHQPQILGSSGEIDRVQD